MEFMMLSISVRKLAKHPASAIEKLRRPNQDVPATPSPDADTDNRTGSQASIVVAGAGIDPNLNHTIEKPYEQDINPKSKARVAPETLKDIISNPQIAKDFVVHPLFMITTRRHRLPEGVHRAYSEAPRIYVWPRSLSLPATNPRACLRAP
jgi:hypothetical protein